MALILITGDAGYVGSHCTKNHTAKFFGLKTYAEMYGQKSTEVLPLLEAPPMNSSNASPPKSHKVMTGPNGSSQQPKGKKKVKKGACD